MESLPKEELAEFEAFRLKKYNVDNVELIYTTIENDTTIEVDREEMQRVTLKINK